MVSGVEYIVILFTTSGAPTTTRMRRKKIKIKYPPWSDFRLRCVWTHLPILRRNDDDDTDRVAVVAHVEV